MPNEDREHYAGEEEKGEFEGEKVERPTIEQMLAYISKKTGFNYKNHVNF